MMRLLRRLISLRRLQQISPIDRIIVGLSATIIVWNTIPELSAFPLVGYISVALSSLPRAQITFMLGFFELVAISYGFLPRIYPNTLFELFAGKRWVRMLLSAYVTMWATYWYVTLLGRVATGYPFLPTLSNELILPLMGIGFVLIGSLLYKWESRDVIHPESYFVHPIRLFSGDDPEDVREENASIPENTVIQIVYRSAVMIAGTSIYVLPVAIFGTLIGVLNVYYPILELAAILAVAGLLVLQNDLTPRSGSWLKKPFESAQEVDERFYQQIRVANSPRAWSLFLLVILSSLFSVLLLLRPPAVFIGTYSTTPETVIRAYTDIIQSVSLSSVVNAAESSGSLIGWVALKITPFGVVCYALWFWYRTIRRLPAYLYQAGTSSKSEDFSPIPSVSRPRGYFVPVVIIATAWISHPLTVPDPFLPLPFEHSNGRFIVLWLIGVGLLCVTLLQTVYSSRNPPKSIHQELVIPSVIHYFIISNFFMSNLVNPSVLAFVILFALMYYLHPMAHAIRSDSRPKRLLGSVGVGLGFGAVGFISPSYSNTISILVATIIFIVFAIGTELDSFSEQ
ncbi:hypothetical protein [Halorubrum distributum]|uniref:hypothetical protein n=1 Tax=Halorubrum distributum TaxID=29283 RepID=UPI0012697290|nr:hypothetical protein [Halorubrum arcis]